jgi:hypothetical protein
MAFPSDTGPFQQIGPRDDPAAISRVSVGETITELELGRMLHSAHRNYTNSSRPMGSMDRWCNAPNAPDAQAAALEVDNTGSGSPSAYETAGHILLPRALDREGYDALVDAEDCTARISIYRVDTGALVGQLDTGSITGRNPAASLGFSTSGVTLGVEVYIVVEISANASALGRLYSVRLHEANTST